jgi:hypothetical protein
MNAVFNPTKKTTLQDQLIDDCQIFCEAHNMTAAEFSNQAHAQFLHHHKQIEARAEQELVPKPLVLTEAQKIKIVGEVLKVQGAIEKPLLLKSDERREIVAIEIVNQLKKAGQKIA